jgi:uncharacterized membrane protein
MLPATRARRNREFVDGFRQRGLEVSRLESFSDAVFGFAVTLLVVSLDVPRTFADLFNAMHGFPAFAVCFLFLALIWNSHYKFCRRFGLDDGAARFLTCVLLFLVLFFIYPLKFLFNLSITSMIFGAPANSMRITADQLSAVLVIYGLGFAAVWLALTFLYLHAYRLRVALELTELERFDTRYQIHRLLILVAIGLLAAAFARIRPLLFWSGWTYLLLFPVLRIYAVSYRQKRRALFANPAGR